MIPLWKLDGSDFPFEMEDNDSEFLTRSAGCYIHCAKSNFSSSTLISSSTFRTGGQPHASSNLPENQETFMKLDRSKLSIIKYWVEYGHAMPLWSMANIRPMLSSFPVANCVRSSSSSSSTEKFSVFVHNVNESNAKFCRSNDDLSSFFFKKNHHWCCYNMKIVHVIAFICLALWAASVDRGWLTLDSGTVCRSQCLKKHGAAYYTCVTDLVHPW